MLLYGTDAAALSVFARKGLRKIFSLVRRFGDDIGDKDIRVVQRINIQRLRWLAMSFEWRRILQQDVYSMRGSVEVGGKDDVAYVGRNKTRKPCHRLVSPTGVGA